MGTRNGNKFIYVYNIYCENVFFFKMGMLNLCIYCNESFIRVHDSPLQPSHPLQWQVGTSNCRFGTRPGRSCRDKNFTARWVAGTYSKKQALRETGVWDMFPIAWCVVPCSRPNFDACCVMRLLWCCQPSGFLVSAGRQGFFSTSSNPCSIFLVLRHGVASLDSGGFYALTARVLQGNNFASEVARACEHSDLKGTEDPSRIKCPHETISTKT